MPLSPFFLIRPPSRSQVQKQEKGLRSIRFFGFFVPPERPMNEEMRRKEESYLFLLLTDSSRNRKTFLSRLPSLSLRQEPPRLVAILQRRVAILVSKDFGSRKRIPRGISNLWFLTGKIDKMVALEGKEPSLRFEFTLSSCVPSCFSVSRSLACSYFKFIPRFALSKREKIT